MIERLRAALGLAPGDHRAVVRALRCDERPLRLAYAAVAGTTVADLRERLAEAGDHDRLAWPRFEDYRTAVLKGQRAVRRRDCRLLWERDGVRAYRINGLDFHAIVVRRGGEVEFRRGDPEMAVTVDGR